MATTVDIVPITPAMIQPAWVKTPPTYTTGPGETNSVNDYTPRTTAERAGAVGGPNGAAQPIPPTNLPVQDPNPVFARTMKAGLERTPYPTGLPNDITSSDIVTPVECNPTLKVVSDPAVGT